MSTPDRRGMLDRADKALSIRRQCMLLGIARSGVYRPPRPANDNELGRVLGAHLRDEHDEHPDEEELAELIADEAYEAMDS